jgi:maltose alpha-D-glucosyltransferase/alpha-amylase
MLEGSRLISDTIDNARVVAQIEIDKKYDFIQMLFVEFAFIEKESELFFIPIAFGFTDEAHKVLSENPNAIIANYEIGGRSGIAYDAVYCEIFREQLLKIFKSPKHSAHAYLNIIAEPKHKKELSSVSPVSNLLDRRKINAHICYDKKLFLKLFRRLEVGELPDVEMMRTLQDSGFANLPKFFAGLFYKNNISTYQIATLEEWVTNGVEATHIIFDASTNLINELLSKKHDIKFIMDQHQEKTALIHEIIGGYLFENISILGATIANMHKNIYSHQKYADFKPESYSELYLHSIYQSFRSSLKKTVALLRKNIDYFHNTQDEIKDILLLHQ